MSSTAVAIDREANPLVVLRTQLEQRAAEFQMVLPKHIEPDRFQRTILTAVQKNPDLLKADRRSLITACMMAAQDGCLPDGREAALVIFKTRQKDANGQWVSVQLVQYMCMVFGLRKKILQSGDITDIKPAVVYRREVEEERFYYEEGTEAALRHKPILDLTEEEAVDENIVAAYSIATYKDGTKSYEVMRRFEVDKVRQCSQTGAVGKTDRSGSPIPPKGPWVDWYPEQAKKTVMRRHSKTLPMSSDIIDVEADADARAANQLSAARSAVALLGSANADAPLAIDDDHSDDIDVPHDPETGEIIDAEPEGKPTPPRRQRKAQAEEQRPDTVTSDNPAAGEGPAEEQRGEDATPADHPAWRTADAIKVEAEAVGMMPDLNSLRSRARNDLEAMPDEVRVSVEEAFAAAERRLKGGQ